jgi:glyoxylase-like metal-dependent hydrolase (beta-lactamase superfamily II)
MEILPGIHRIASTVGGRPLYLYLLRGSQRTVLIDTGTASDPAAVLFPYLARLGLQPTDLDVVIVTHSDLDHCGGNAAIKQAHPDVVLSCGEADRFLIEDPARMLAFRYTHYAERHGIAYDAATQQSIRAALGAPQPVDCTWRGGEVLRLGPDWLVELHHTPGHSFGHLTVFDPRRRIAFTGDAVQGRVYPDTAGRPALCPTYLYVDQYLQTITYLEQLRPELLCGSHWPVWQGDQASRFLAESRQFVELADRLVREALRERPHTLRELITHLGPRLGEWPRTVDLELVYCLHGHLERLAAREEVLVDDTQRPVVYRAR